VNWKLESSYRRRESHPKETIKHLANVATTVLVGKFDREEDTTWNHTNLSGENLEAAELSGDVQATKLGNLKKGK